MDELSLDERGECAGGDRESFDRRKRTERELERVKKWEDEVREASRPIREGGGMDRGALSSEAAPPIPDGPPSAMKSEDEAVLQASGVKSP